MLRRVDQPLYSWRPEEYDKARETGAISSLTVGLEWCYLSGEGRTSDIALIASCLSGATLTRNLFQLSSWRGHELGLAEKKSMKVAL